ncbi:hypothetical protein EB061_11205 [bacterium]|nr:hypothetical protein [bacterium]
MKSGVLTAAIALVCLIATEMGLSAATAHRVWIPEEEQSLQGILQHEVDEMTSSYHPKRVIMLMMDPRTGVIEGGAASKGGKLQSHSGTLQEAKRFRFDPGALVDSFTSSELAQCGIRTPVSTTAFDLIHLFSAVAEGGTLKPENKMIFPMDRIKVLQEGLIGQIHGKDAPIRLARVDGIRVAGAAGHGGKNPIAACFAGYFPADHPRHVCVVVVEGADVVMKYQRGTLLAAPHFSFAARKVQRLDVTQ